MRFKIYYDFFGVILDIWLLEFVFDELFDFKGNEVLCKWYVYFLMVMRSIKKIISVQDFICSKY